MALAPLRRFLTRMAVAPRLSARICTWGLPRRSLVFGPLSLGDDLLCTAVLREARRRQTPFVMMTEHPELFAHNADPAAVRALDPHYLALLRRFGRPAVQPYYVSAAPDDPERDRLPSRPIIAEMCARAGLQGTIALRPYLTLTDHERTAGRRFPRQISLQSTGRGAAIPYPAKEWGPSRFAEVARLLATHAQLIQLGSARDPALPVDLDLRGKTKLRESAAILAASELFIGLEGFLSHLARAVDCPAVVVLGGRAPAEVFGYSANRNLTAFPPCAPCGRRTGCPRDMQCMTAIAPRAVATAARDILDHPPARPLPATPFHLSPALSVNAPYRSSSLFAASPHAQ